MKEKFRSTNSPTKRSLKEKSIVSISTLGIIVLILVGVSGMLSKTKLTREDLSS